MQALRHVVDEKRTEIEALCMCLVACCDQMCCMQALRHAVDEKQAEIDALNGDMDALTNALEVTFNVYVCMHAYICIYE